MSFEDPPLDEKEERILDEGQEVDLWFRVLRGALNVPGVRIDRAGYLRNQLVPRYSQETVRMAIQKNPAAAGIRNGDIRRLANAAIRLHSYRAAGMSFLLGLPGGWWMAGSIPIDLTQFYANVLQLLQKLAYLYGWPDLVSSDQFDDETLLEVSLLVGVMMGAEGAGAGIRKLAEALAEQVGKRLPDEALTKYGVYNIAKQVAKWIGVSLTKKSFADIVKKVVPIVGGFVSGGISFAFMRAMGKRLQKHLSELPLAKVTAIMEA